MKKGEDRSANKWQGNVERCQTLNAMVLGMIGMIEVGNFSPYDARAIHSRTSTTRARRMKPERVLLLHSKVVSEGPAP